MNIGEIKTELRDDLSVASGDSFYGNAYIDRITTKAVQWLAGLKNWQETQFAYDVELTIAGDATDEYWNYPENFKTDSIYRLDIGGERYERIAWEEYLNYQENHSGSANDKIFSDHRRQYFINPRPTVDVTVSVWGHRIPTDEDLDSDSDTHPFDTNQVLEDALMKFALAKAYKKGRGSMYNRGVALEREARAIAEDEWKKQLAEQAKYKTKDAAMFTWQDLLPVNGERRTKRGSFREC